MSSTTVNRIRIDLVPAWILIEIVDLLEVHRLALASDMENIGDEPWLPFRLRKPSQVIRQSQVQVKNRWRPASCSALSQEDERRRTDCRPPELIQRRAALPDDPGPRS